MSRCRLLIKLILSILILSTESTGIAYGREFSDSLEYDIRVTATLSGGEHSPFWLVSNRQGLASPEKNYGYLRGSLLKHLDPDKRFSWGAGVDLVGGWELPAPFNIHQLFGEIKYRALYAMVGAKEIHSPYNNPKLSSGDLVFSENYMPIPQIRIGTYDFSDFWGCNGWFSVKAYIAFGKFTDSRWQTSWVAPGEQHNKGALLNSKGLWLRGGNKEKFPLTADIGIEMATQFGGTIYKEGQVIRMPEKVIDWLKAIIPLSGGKNTPLSEQTNVQGNMLGAYNIVLQWQPRADWSIKGYFEHYFEDHSQMTFEYGWKDGLWGIEATLPKNKWVSKIVAEYIYMKDQTGAVNHDWTPEVPEQVSGADNYYNHHLYSSWQNWGMSIGTPLAISPLYNVDHRLYIYDTRFIGYHLGLEGNPMKELDWRILLTFTQNWGTYRFPLVNVLNNFSGLAEINYHPKKLLKGWYAKVGIGWDAGHLLGKSIGAMVTIGKTGFIKW